MGRRSRPKKPPFVGVGGKIEERVEEAQYPWTTLRKRFRSLREEEESGFTFLRLALEEEHRWRTQLLRFGIDGKNVTDCRTVEGVRQAQTDEELSDRNYAYGCLRAWQPVANDGVAFLRCEWALYRVVAKARRQPVLDLQDWLPGPPVLSARLFDVLSRTLIQAMAESQGQVMEDIPKEREGEQANYLLAGLLRTRIRLDGQIGKALKFSLSVLAGKDFDSALKTQLLRELPGATRIAWSERGRRMTPDRRKGETYATFYYYYRCNTHRDRGPEACPNRKIRRAEKTEPLVWTFVSSLLQNPVQLRLGLKRLIEEEKSAMRGDPERETKAWLRSIEESNRQRAKAQELAIEGLLSHEELRIKLSEIEERRETAQRELATLTRHKEWVEELERDAETLLSSYAAAVPDALETLTGEERRRVYKMLRLKVSAYADGTITASGALTSEGQLCIDGGMSRPTTIPHTVSNFQVS